MEGQNALTRGNKWVFSQLVFESDGKGKETHYKIDPQNGNVLAVTRVVGATTSNTDPLNLVLGENVSREQLADINGDG